MIKIEKNIPIPPRRVGRAVGAGRPPAIGYEGRALMNKMEIGDSIKVLGTFSKNTMYVFTSREGKRLGKKFRTVEEIGGYRIWRTA
jgi:hypothetical protein